MEILFSILAVGALIFCVVMIVDKTVFDKKIKEIGLGLTGKEIQDMTGKKLKIVKVEGNSYQAIVMSTLTIFKYRLVFFEGKLISKQKE